MFMFQAKSPDPFIHIVSTTQLNGTGQYYIGVQLIQSNSSEENTGAVDVLKYSLRMWEVACKLWDDEKKIYSSDGCKVRSTT